MKTIWLFLIITTFFFIEAKSQEIEYEIDNGKYVFIHGDKTMDFYEVINSMEIFSEEQNLMQKALFIKNSSIGLQFVGGAVLASQVVRYVRRGIVNRYLFIGSVSAIGLSIPLAVNTKPILKESIILHNEKFKDLSFSKPSYQLNLTASINGVGVVMLW